MQIWTVGTYTVTFDGTQLTRGADLNSELVAELQRGDVVRSTQLPSLRWRGGGGVTRGGLRGRSGGWRMGSYGPRGQCGWRTE